MTLTFSLSLSSARCRRRVIKLENVNDTQPRRAPLVLNDTPPPAIAFAGLQQNYFLQSMTTQHQWYGK